MYFDVKKAVDLFFIEVYLFTVLQVYSKVTQLQIYTYIYISIYILFFRFFSTIGN